MIQIQNITKSFGKRELFKNFSLEVAPKSFVMITGTSGSGKSTLLNMIGNLESCDTGTIKINGIVLGKKSNSKIYRDTITYIFQNYGLIPEENVRDNLLPSLKFTKLSKKEKTREIINALNKVGLSNVLEQPVYSLSGGEQQRVAIAKAILKPSQIVLADEPTGNLDEENTGKIMDLLRYMNEKLGKTLIVVTHNRDLIIGTDIEVKLDELNQTKIY